jgi:Lon protease-like protein
MYEIPLFPLNTVLFPGLPLQLHIFEERYRQMVAYCRVENRPFGVVLIKHGLEAHGPLAETHSVGCSANIAQLLPLSDGRYNLLAAGQERFRIHSLDYSKPYLVGMVENIPIESEDEFACLRADNKLRPWFEKYIRLIAPPDETLKFLNHLPDDPARFGYLAANLLQIPPVQKQAFLEINTCPDLFEQLIDAYRREIALVNHLQQFPAREQPRGFSIN